MKGMAHGPKDDLNFLAGVHELRVRSFVLFLPCSTEAEVGDVLIVAVVLPNEEHGHWHSSNWLALPDKVPMVQNLGKAEEHGK